MLKNKIIICLLAVLCAACSIPQAKFSVISTRDIQAEHLDLTKLKTTKDVLGESSDSCITYGLGGSLSGAVEDALRKGDGDLMINSTAYMKGCIVKIKGDVVNTKVLKEGE